MFNKQANSTDSLPHGSETWNSRITAINSKRQFHSTNCLVGKALDLCVRGDVNTGWSTNGKV